MSPIAVTNFVSPRGASVALGPQDLAPLETRNRDAAAATDTVVYRLSSYEEQIEAPGLAD